MRFRNEALSPWRRPSNCAKVQPGECFEATEGEAAAIGRRHLTFLVPVEDDLEPWALRVSPQEYLEKWPNGRHAALARRHLGQPAEAVA